MVTWSIISRDLSILINTKLFRSAYYVCMCTFIGVSTGLCIRMSTSDLQKNQTCVDKYYSICNEIGLNRQITLILWYFSRPCSALI